MICPKCKKKIEYLHEYQEGEMKYDFSLDKNKEPDYSEVGFQPATQIEYECPECTETLFYNQKDAIEFLLK